MGDAHLDARFGRVAALSGEALRAYAETVVSSISRSLDCVSGTPSDREEALVRALDADEMVAYLRYRAATHLTSNSWRMRNAGVKMVGILRQRDKLPVLAGFVKDRTPASRMRRLLGGDFETNGFIRRNSMASLIRLGVASPVVREVILCGLADPYFEVRSQAARAVQVFCGSLENDKEIVERLLNCAKDRYFEVVVEAVKALGSVAFAETVLEVFRSLSQHQNWRVRQAVVEGCCALLDRGQDVPKAFLSEILAGMMVTSTGFCPSFSLKLAVAKLGERIREPDNAAGDRGKS
ncbi:MAG: HEAT repeat protein [Candidatus Latescibacteria bacterium ADurb.Bin168]|nr:MAG: HEAT repeat protein [Candidatus Latescibacteria bacterium ADurb.Bin168]